MDKIKNIYRVNKKGLFCILVITIIGVIAGSLFYFLLSNSDKELVINSISDFFNSIINNNFNYKDSLKSNLIINLVYILIIWLLGISIIGLPIILVLYFFKSFTLGFSLVSIISKYGFKGTIYGFIYLFPHNVINILSYAILSLYAIICSFRVLSNLTKKDKIDLNPIMGRYKLVLLLTILISILSCLYQSFVMPNLLKIVLKFIN